MNGLGGNLLDLLWPAPPLCPGCWQPAPRTEPGRLCRRCRERLVVLRPPVCRRCGRPAGGEDECRQCAGRPRTFVEARAAGPYEGELKRLVHRFKFRRELALREPLGLLLAETFRAWPELRAAELLIPVPLSAERRAERGFNQAEELARVAGRALRLPAVMDALVRERGGPAQSRRSRHDRERGAAGAFRVARPGALAGARVLLVDDVLTTGATAEACSQAMLKAGASRVSVLTLATTLAHGLGDSP
ncbi:MAG: ComF family protein [Chitinophagales bacterium]